MTNKTKKLTTNVLKNILAWLISIIMLVPLALIVVTAFKPEAEATSLNLSLPSTWTLENFTTAIEKGKLVQSFLNSLLYASCATVLVVIL